MLKTLDEVRDSVVPSFAGVCATSSDFTALVNNATQRLMRRGDWPGTVVPIQVCAHMGCIVFPRYVGEVRKLNVCNQPLTIRNEWYSFLQFENPNFIEGNGIGYGTGSTYWSNGGSGGNGWLGARAWATGGVSTPVFQDIMGDGRFVRFYPRVQADIGKTVTVYGTDNNGQTLTHKLSDGTWQDGWVVTLNIPFGSTTDYLSLIHI